MNKKELVAKLAKTTGISQAKAADVVNALFDADPGKGIIAIELDDRINDLDLAHLVTPVYSDNLMAAITW